MTEPAVETRERHLQETVALVSAYASNNSLTPAEVPELIGAIFTTLEGLANQTADQTAWKPIRPMAEVTANPDLVPAIAISESVTHDYVVCLDCGAHMVTLRRHIQASHGLSVPDYLARWHLPRDYALVAPAYSARRSELAKGFGLGSTIARRARRSNSEQQPSA